MEIYEFSPAEAWDWITDGREFNDLTSSERRLALDRANELFDIVNALSETTELSKKLVGGLNFQICTGFVISFINHLKY